LHDVLSHPDIPTLLPSLIDHNEHVETAVVQGATEVRTVGARRHKRAAADGPLELVVLPTDVGESASDEETSGGENDSSLSQPQLDSLLSFVRTIAGELQQGLIVVGDTAQSTAQAQQRKRASTTSVPSSCIGALGSWPFPLDVRAAGIAPQQTVVLLKVADVSQQASALGASSVCLAHANGRPAAAQLTISQSLASALFSGQRPVALLTSVARHELLHALGWNGDTIASRMTITQVAGRGGGTGAPGRVAVAGPAAVAAAQRHFGCDTLDAVPLELVTSPSPTADTITPSHLDSLTFASELMSPFIPPGGATTSPISLAVLVDTGLYRLTPALSGDPLEWGAGAGCAFLTTPCASLSSTLQDSRYDTCPPSPTPTQACHMATSAKATCHVTTYPESLPDWAQYKSDSSKGGSESNDYCAFAVRGGVGSSCAGPVGRAGVGGGDGVEVWGDSSVCVEGSLVSAASAAAAAAGEPSAYCFPLRCTPDNLVTFVVAGESVECPPGGGTVSVPASSGVAGTIVCPPASSLCCGTCVNGQCVNGACDCLQGWTGVGCNAARTDQAPLWLGHLDGVVPTPLAFPTPAPMPSPTTPSTDDDDTVVIVLVVTASVCACISLYLSACAIFSFCMRRRPSPVLQRSRRATAAMIAPSFYRPRPAPSPPPSPADSMRAASLHACSVCSSSFSSLDELTAHAKDTGHSVQCDVCGDTFVRDIDRAHHKQRRH